MISYINGDATVPIIEKGVRIITHIVNDAGKFGAGFSGALTKRWKVVGEEYFGAMRPRWGSAKFKLGDVQWTFIEPMEPELTVCNLFAQHGVRHQSNRSPIRYDALDQCLQKLAEGARGLEGEVRVPSWRKLVTIHLPRIGTGLAGGSWDKIEPLIAEQLWDFPVYVYDPATPPMPPPLSSPSSPKAP